MIFSQQTSLKTHHISNLSKLPWSIDQTWDVTLRLPSWLLTFFSISRGLYLCLKLGLHAYFITEESNQLILQSAFFRQALERWDLTENRAEAGWLTIVYFWPNQEHREQQGIIHIPAEVNLETTVEIFRLLNWSECHMLHLMIESLGVLHWYIPHV